MANPGAAYGASALPPSTGMGAGPGTASCAAQAAAKPQLISQLQQPLKDADDYTGDIEDGHTGHHGLALPFEPVALVFKNVHYFVKHLDGSGELELLKVRLLLCDACN